MSDFIFLWMNRERPVSFKRFCIVWTKRIFLFRQLTILLIRSQIFRWRGAHIGRLVVLGESKVKGDFRKLSIGDECSLGRCDIALHDEVILGRGVVLNDGVRLLTASHALRDPAWTHVKAPIVIDDYAWVATGAILMNGVRVGRGAVIGAGAVVRESVPDYAVATGNPAVISQSRRCEFFTYSPVMLIAPFEAWVGSQ